MPVQWRLIAPSIINNNGRDMTFSGNAFSILMHEEGIAELGFNTQDAKLNIFTTAAVAELSEALDALERSADLKGLIITGNESGFCAGADIGEFQSQYRGGPEAVIATVTANIRNYNRIELLQVPVVAAVNGMALGGGLELCLACDYRIAADNAVIGLPECNLGIIPGWGGTVRLPRIAGFDTAAEWIAFAQQQPAVKGLQAGVLDAVVEPERLRDAARHTLRQCIDGKLDYRARRRQKTSPMQLNGVELAMAHESCRGVVLMRLGTHYPAPVAAIDLIREAAALDRDAALALESSTLATLTATPEAHALTGVFINERAVMKQARSWIKRSDRGIERAAVLGAGIMGGGIAFQSALSGIPIRMRDIAQRGLDLGLSEAGKLLSRRVERGRMAPAQMGQTLNNIIPGLGYEGFDGVDIVVEAVVEKPEVKLAVLAEVEQQVREDTVLASNTSTISITSLAAALQRPQNFCGMHFFNPVHAMPLVEVIRGEQSADSTIARTVAYAAALGKKPVIVRDCPGFLVNRTLYPYFLGFMLLLRDGADYQQVDQVMEQWGWPMGPAYLLDVVGLDPVVHSEQVMASGYPERMTAIDDNALSVLFQAGRLGQKTGAGFYQYQEDSRGRPRKTPAAETYELLSPHCDALREVSTDEITARMIVPMGLEMARCLEDGIVASAAEADTALVLGLGFPRFRGGILRWMDSVGLDNVCEMADYYAGLGGLYQVPESLRRLAQAGGGFYND